MKVGKVLGAQGIHEGALQAYTNALNLLANETSPEKCQREILSSYCSHYMNLDHYRCKYAVKTMLSQLPVT